MTFHRNISMALSLALLLTATVAAQGNLTDPYQILNQHFEANGGLERVKAEKSQYIEASLTVAGLNGTLKVWTLKPDCSRSEADLGVLKVTQGDNGQYQWVLDVNGKLQKITKLDEATIKRKGLKKRLDRFEYADPQSDVFTVTLEGIEKVEERDCYVIKIVNSINPDVQRSYINTENFLLEKTVGNDGDKSSETLYGDYREVAGLKVAFRSVQTSLETGQTQEVTVSRYDSNADIDRSIFDPPEQAGKDYKFAEGNSTEDIPVQFIGGHLYIPVTVGCKQRLWILDTGASVSVISKQFADELGLELQGDLKGKGAGGTIDLKLATLPPYSLPGIEFEEQTVAVMDTEELIRHLGVDIAGILGFDFLSRFVMKVDYARELVSFYDPETFEYTGDGHKADVHMKNGVFMVEATLDGTHSGIWLFDVGASSVSLDGAYALQNGFTEKKGVESVARGAANAFGVKVIRCRSLEIAGFTVDNPPVSFPYGGTDSVFTADRIGDLGSSLFKNFIIYCDYAGERLIVEKGDDFNQPIRLDRSGLKLAYGEQGEIEVVFVPEGTPAWKAGLREKDVVKSINGIDVKYLESVIAIRKMLQEDVGTKYSFVVDRDGQQKKLKLTLADLL